MNPQSHTTSNLTYETNELKLAALLLAEIPKSFVEVYQQPNSIRKTIKITYLPIYESDVSKLERDFINKQAMANVYLYNKALNTIRDKLRGQI